MTVLKKNRFGVNTMIFAFLLSLLVPPSATETTAVDVSGTVYTALKSRYVKNELNDKIKQAIENGKHFYIGVAMKYGTEEQSLCNRQGGTATKQNGVFKCTRSTHHRDVEACGEKGGLKLINVFYTNTFMKRVAVCTTEMSLIKDNNCLDEELCLNKRSGQPDCCITENEGIVYLRIYESKTPSRAKTLSGDPGTKKKIKTNNYYLNGI